MAFEKAWKTPGFFFLLLRGQPADVIIIIIIIIMLLAFPHCHAILATAVQRSL